MSVMAIRCVVFDFDGVLVQSNRAKRDAYDHAVRDLPVSPGTIAACLERHPEGDRHTILDCVVRALQLPADIHEATVARCVRAYGEQCDALLSECAETEGASDILTRLAAAYPLYVNSATPEAMLRTYIARRGWSSMFRGVYGRPRSKLEILQSIANLEALVPEEVLFVGDRHTDHAAAQAAGCRFLGLRSDGCDLDERRALVVDSLASVLTYIAREVTGC